MTQRQKLIETFRQNPKAVRFDDACQLAGWLGFIYSGGQGSHRVFKRSGEPVQLNFQNCNGTIPPCHLSISTRQYFGSCKII